MLHAVCAQTPIAVLAWAHPLQCPYHRHGEICTRSSRLILASHPQDVQCGRADKSTFASWWFTPTMPLLGQTQTNFADLLLFCVYFQVDFMGGDLNVFSYRYFKAGRQQIAGSLQDSSLAICDVVMGGVNPQNRNTYTFSASQSHINK